MRGGDVDRYGKSLKSRRRNKTVRDDHDAILKFDRVAKNNPGKVERGIVRWEEVGRWLNAFVRAWVAFSMENSVRDMQREFKTLKEATQSIFIVTIHVLHELSHIKLKLTPYFGHHPLKEMTCRPMTFTEDLGKGKGSMDLDP
eukprot:Gb_29979 [translate_table: standard]